MIAAFVSKLCSDVWEKCSQFLDASFLYPLLQDENLTAA